MRRMKGVGRRLKCSGFFCSAHFSTNIMLDEEVGKRSLKSQFGTDPKQYKSYWGTFPYTNTCRNRRK